jgi:hypothetical protein
LAACFVVKDHDGQNLAYVYFEDEPGRIGGEIIGSGRSETDRRQHCEIAGAIRASSDVGSAMKTSAAHTQQSRRRTGGFASSPRQCQDDP